jgi:hypothetical protein
MKRYVEGQDRSQATLFPESLDEYIADFPIGIRPAHICGLGRISVFRRPRPKGESEGCLPSGSQLYKEKGKKLLIYNN